MAKQTDQHHQKGAAAEQVTGAGSLGELKVPLTAELLHAKMRRAKELSGLTGDQIGEKMGVKEGGRKQAVNDLLTRITNPGIFTVANFAQATGLSLLELLQLPSSDRK